MAGIICFMLVTKRPGRPRGIVDSRFSIGSPTPTMKKLARLKNSGKSWREIADELSTEAVRISPSTVWKVAKGLVRSRKVDAALSPKSMHKTQHRRAGLFATAEEAAAWDEMMAAMDTTTTEWMRRKLREWQE